MFGELLDEFHAWSWPELIAVGAAIAYLLLAIRQNILCWFFAAVSTAIYVYLFIQANLYMESVLNLFYLAMAFFGWWQWSTGATDSGVREVTRWPLRRHFVAIITTTAIAITNGYLLQAYTDAALPYVDSLTTWFAIWATFLVAKKSVGELVVLVVDRRRFYFRLLVA